MVKTFKPDATLKHLDSKVDNVKGHIKIEWILDSVAKIVVSTKLKKAEWNNSTIISKI